MLRRLFLFSFLVFFPLFSVSAQDASSVDGKWNLVWADEFDGDSLDLTKWSYEDDCWGGGNNERQCYTKKKKMWLLKADF